MIINGARLIDSAGKRLITDNGYRQITDGTPEKDLCDCECGPPPIPSFFWIDSCTSQRTIYTYPVAAPPPQPFVNIPGPGGRCLFASAFTSPPGAALPIGAIYTPVKNNPSMYVTLEIEFSGVGIGVDGIYTTPIIPGGAPHTYVIPVGGSDIFIFSAAFTDNFWVFGLVVFTTGATSLFSATNGHTICCFADDSLTLPNTFGTGTAVLRVLQV